MDGAPGNVDERSPRPPSATTTARQAMGGSLPIAFRHYAQGTKMPATGYRAGGKYSAGHELIYCVSQADTQGAAEE